MVKNSNRPSSRWLDWKASARAAAIRASHSLLDFGGTESASFRDLTASIRCEMASSATLAVDTASRWDAASARIEWMRYSYYQSQIRIHSARERRSSERQDWLAPVSRLRQREKERTLCAKLGITVIHILSAPTGRCGYAVMRKWWNNRMSAIVCVPVRSASADFASGLLTKVPGVDCKWTISWGLGEVGVRWRDWMMFAG